EDAAERQTEHRSARPADEDAEDGTDDDDRQDDEAVGDAHQHRVDPAAVVAGQRCNDRADDRQTAPMMNMTMMEICVPFITRAKLSRPISSCPKGCSPSEKMFDSDQVGAPPGLTTCPEAV